MQQTILEIPYKQNEKSCMLYVEYGVNTDPITSGFEIVKNLVPDLNICIGYPTMHAFVKEHGGYGFSRYCGFVQVVTMKSENENIKMVDVPQTMNGIPFFAYGYPGEIYDAPVNNYGLGNELEWTAKTFVVDMPSFVNNNQISFLTGFKWGYTESNSDNRKKIELMPVEIIDKEDWIQEIPFLKENCPNWNFAE